MGGYPRIAGLKRKTKNLVGFLAASPVPAMQKLAGRLEHSRNWRF
jgi:hypothetical protein